MRTRQHIGVVIFWLVTITLMFSQCLRYRRGAGGINTIAHSRAGAPTHSTNLRSPFTT